MTRTDGESAEQRLFNAVARWDAATGRGLADMIDAACTALIEGLDAPTLRELAGASVKDSSWDIRELVSRSFEELDIPYPGTAASARRPGVDSLRLEVAPVPTSTEAGGGFQLRVYVNDVEMTSAGAGLGMDPYDVLVPANLLTAISQPRTVPIARCECGVYGCGATDVTITRDGDLVRWDWSVEVPMNRSVLFAASRYDAEVARVAADHSWETPERTAGRLVLTGLDRDRLLAHGLTPSWAANHYRDNELFRIALQIDGDYQVFLDVPWRDRGPEDMAHAVCATLARPPSEWSATWHAIQRGTSGPPTIAGRRWRPEGQMP